MKTGTYLKNPQQCRRFLSKCVNEVRAEKLSPDALRAITSAVQCVLKIFEFEENTERLQDIERRIYELTRNNQT